MRFGFSILALSLWATGTLVLVSPAAAQSGVQEPPTELDGAARALFDAGKRAYDAGDYETALARFRAAFDLTQRPLLMYNVAQALDRLRRDEEAIAAYQRFIELDPNSEIRGTAEARVRNMQRAIDEQHAREAEAQARQNQAQSQEGSPHASPPRDDEGGGGLPPVVFISAAAVTAVFAGITIWSGLDTSSLNDDYLATTTADDAKTALDDAESAQTRTNVLLGVTVGAAAVTGVLAVLTNWSGDTEERPVASIGISPDGAMATVRGAF